MVAIINSLRRVSSLYTTYAEAPNFQLSPFPKLLSWTQSSTQRLPLFSRTFSEKAHVHMSDRLVSQLFTSLCVWQMVTPDEEASQIRIVQFLQSHCLYWVRCGQNCKPRLFGLGCLLNPSRSAAEPGPGSACSDREKVNSDHTTDIFGSVHFSLSPPSRCTQTETLQRNWIRNVRNRNKWPCQDRPLPIKALQLKGYSTIQKATASVKALRWAHHLCKTGCFSVWIRGRNSPCYNCLQFLAYRWMYTADGVLRYVTAIWTKENICTNLCSL